MSILRGSLLMCGSRPYLAVAFEVDVHKPSLLISALSNAPPARSLYALFSTLQLISVDDVDGKTTLMVRDAHGRNLMLEGRCSSVQPPGWNCSPPPLSHSSDYNFVFTQPQIMYLVDWIAFQHPSAARFQNIAHKLRLHLPNPTILPAEPSATTPIELQTCDWYLHTTPHISSMISGVQMPGTAATGDASTLALRLINMSDGPTGYFQSPCDRTTRKCDCDSGRCIVLDVVHSVSKSAIACCHTTGEVTGEDVSPPPMSVIIQLSSGKSVADGSLICTFDEQQQHVHLLQEVMGGLGGAGIAINALEGCGWGYRAHGATGPSQTPRISLVSTVIFDDKVGCFVEAKPDSNATDWHLLAEDALLGAACLPGSSDRSLTSLQRLLYVVATAMSTGMDYGLRLPGCGVDTQWHSAPSSGSNRSIGLLSSRRSTQRDSFFTVTTLIHEQDDRNTSSTLSAVDVMGNEISKHLVGHTGDPIRNSATTEDVAPVRRSLFGSISSHGGSARSLRSAGHRQSASSTTGDDSPAVTKADAEFSVRIHTASGRLEPLPDALWHTFSYVKSLPASGAASGSHIFNDAYERKASDGIFYLSTTELDKSRHTRKTQSFSAAETLRRSSGGAFERLHSDQLAQSFVPEVANFASAAGSASTNEVSAESAIRSRSTHCKLDMKCSGPHPLSVECSPTVNSPSGHSKALSVEMDIYTPRWHSDVVVPSANPPWSSSDATATPIGIPAVLQPQYAEILRDGSERDPMLYIYLHHIGTLTKRGHIWATWRRRWFELRGDVVTYFVDRWTEDYDHEAPHPSTTLAIPSDALAIAPAELSDVLTLSDKAWRGPLIPVQWPLEPPRPPANLIPTGAQERSCVKHRGRIRGTFRLSPYSRAFAVSLRGRRHCFCVTTTDPHKPFFCQAPNAGARREWLRVLQHNVRVLQAWERRKLLWKTAAEASAMQCTESAGGVETHQTVSVPIPLFQLSFHNAPLPPAL